MSEIRNYVRENRNQEVDNLIESMINDLKEEGFTVEFGKIGNRTSYALLYTEDHEKEIVGYTFVKDMKYYKENVGRLKALQQALARKSLSEEAEAM